MHRSIGSASIVPGPAASSPPGRLLEMQVLEPCPRFTEANSLGVRITLPKIILGKKKVKKCSFLPVMKGNHLYNMNM